MRRIQREAKSALQYPPAVITGRQALPRRDSRRRLARRPIGFLPAILPDHVHLIIGASAAASARSSANFANRARTP